MTGDDRHPVILDPGAPPDPGYLLEVAEAIPAAVRVAIYQTRHDEAMEDPATGYQVACCLESAAGRLPQLLDQIASSYERQAAAGRLKVAGGDPEGGVAMEIAAVRMRVNAAKMSAEQLQAALAKLAQVTATLTAAETGEDDGGALAALCAAAAEQECTWCHVVSGPCVTGPDGWHLARFLGVLPDRASARLAGAAAVPYGHVGGIVRLPVQAGEGDSDD